jgi:hypothetical protein
MRLRRIVANPLISLGSKDCYETEQSPGMQGPAGVCGDPAGVCPQSYPQAEWKTAKVLRIIDLGHESESDFSCVP